MHIVLGDAPSLAAYGGGFAGLAPTDPAVTGVRRLNPSSLPSRAYLSFLGSEQANLISRIEAALGRQVQVRFRYQAVLNGIALQLSPQEAERVSNLPGVDRVVPDSTRRLLTDNGPQWIGAPGAWNGTHTGGAPGTKGEGVVVGVIDTGINTDHPSFADPGPVDDYNYPPPAGGYKGVCDPVTGLPSCNDKLIGVYDFTPVGTGEDENGHGSHTASTSAGNELNAALVAPTLTLNRHISGVAPHANVIAYKACVGLTAPAGECLLTALLAAINQATLDMVDVVNFSIGGGPSDPWTDADSLAFLNARRAGIFVSASAGNDGPGAGSVGSPANAPWLMSVGASTHDRNLVNGLDDLTGGATAPPDDIEGKSLTSGVGPAPIVDAAALGSPLCGEGPVGADGATPTTNPFLPDRVAGKIVLCERGTYGRVAKGQVVKDAGGVGMVLMNDAANGDSLIGDAHVLPAVHISFAKGQTLKTWLASGTGHQGTIRGTTLDIRAGNGDSMASFSSRGPNAAPDVIKPDVTAPGVDILAAFSNEAGPPPQFGVISGTSMSSPHAAGAAALVRALHPAWTPDEVRSALMTTAFTSPPGAGSEVHAVLKEDASTPADPFDMGGGRVDLRRAGRAGLVLDESPDDYEAANPLTGGDPKGLNIPSLANHDCRPTCTWTRVVKSVAPVSGTWNVTSTAPAGATISVAPESVTLAPGATAAITVTVDTSSMPVARWRFGDVTLTPRRTSIPTPHSTLSATRLPVAVRAQGGDVPPPCDIAEGVRTDPMEVNVLPVHDIREVGTSGLYPTFAGEPMPNIIFRMKVATLDPFPTTSHWRIAFRTPGQPANLSWFVQMFRGPDPDGDPTFVYGTLDSAASTFTVLGTPEAGTWSADGTIKITIAASKVGNPQSGDVLSAITGAAGPGVPGTLTLNSDSTSNGAGPTTYTLQQGCPQENLPPVATIRTEPADATIREGQDVVFDGSGSTDDRTPPAELTYEWDFEDDGIYDASGPNVTRRYLVAGSFRARLRVTDAEGLSDTETVIVTVTPFCPTTTFSDDLEPAAEPGWDTETAVNESPVPSATWSQVSDLGAHSPGHSWFSDAKTVFPKDDLLMTPPQDLTATSRLTFWHRFYFEPGFDGGVLEVSSAGGPWRDVADAGGSFVEGGYNDTISTDFGSPIAGRDAWSGGSETAELDSMTQVIVDVGALAGENVRFRFRLAADEFGALALPGMAWWIDDLQITGIPLPCNRPPVAIDDSASTIEETPVTIDVLANDSDPESQPLTVTALTQPAHGSVVNNGNGTVTYTPDAGFISPPDDTFSYTVSDGENSVTANVSVTVNQRPNRAPTAGDDAAETVQDAPVTINVLSNDSDPDGDTLTVKSPTTTQPQNGSAGVNGDNTITYTPREGFLGTDTFDYTVEDGKGGEDTATVMVTVKAPPNRPPTAVDDTAGTQKNTAVTVNVIANDSDSDNDPLSVTNVTQPANGTVVNNGGGTVTYTPKNDFVGSDSFNYTISDGRGGSSTAKVTINVTGTANRAPTARNDSAKTSRNKSVTVQVLRNDSDPDGDALTVDQASDPPKGSVRINRGRTVTYTPDSGFVGTDTFTYRITDGKGGTSTAQVTISVTKGDDDDDDNDDDDD